DLINFPHFYAHTLPRKLEETINLINKINPEQKKPLFNRGFYIQLLVLQEFCEVEVENMLQPYEQKFITFEIAKLKLQDHYENYIIALHASKQKNSFLPLSQ